MSLNNQLVAELVRQRMGSKDDSIAPRVMLMIPHALKATARKVAADPRLRPLMTTPKATTAIAITSGGKVDLTTGYDTWKFLLEFFDQGFCYLRPSITVLPYISAVDVSATGTWTFRGLPYDGETIDVNGYTYTVDYSRIANDPPSMLDVATLFASDLNASTNPLVSVATYATPVAGLDRNTYIVVGTYDTGGTGGNAFTMEASFGNNITASGPTFTGGSDAVWQLSVSESSAYLVDGARVHFSSTGGLPNPFVVNADYYITDYDSSSDPINFTLLDEFGDPVIITDGGTGILTMTFMDATGLPMQRLRSPKQAELDNNLDSVFTYFYIDASTMYVLPSTTAGSVAFAVPYFPTVVTALADSEEIERMFLDKVMELLMPAPNDAPQDGER